MTIGLPTGQLERLIKQDVLAIMDSRLNKSFEGMAEGVANAIEANNAALEQRLRAAGVAL